MDDQRNEGDKLDEVLLPGFRFHPTDEELVAFYLRRKIQQRPLSIELIKQLDIYKYDPWDLPKLATTGEKEWYFYCPRDRKYRNSVRPNRVTGAGFWKATGTDRPIYSSQGSKCIGLKKSLVFYKGRAAKGIKTDWMMHEFRLPSLLTDSAAPAAKRLFDKNHIPANDSWAICRIFKKTTSTAQRTLSHSWVVSPYPESTPLEHIPSNQRPHHPRHGSSDNDPFTAQFSTNNNDLKHSFNSCFTPQYVPPSKPITTHQVLPISNTELTNSSLPFSHFFNAAGPPGKCAVDVSSMLLNMSSPSALLLGGFGESVPEEVHNNNSNNSDLSSLLPLQEMVQYKNLLGEGEESHGLMMKNQELHGNAQWGALQWCNGFPHSLPLLWDSSPCPSDISTSFSTNKPPN